MFIHAKTEEMCRGRMFSRWLPVSSVHVVPSSSWNDCVSYEKRGPVTGVRIWRANIAIFGIQLKYGQIWEEERGLKFNIPNWCFFCCCHPSIKKHLEMIEINLDHGELINKVKTKNNISASADGGPRSRVCAR